MADRQAIWESYEAALVQSWLARFELALAAGDRDEVRRLFVDDAHWRDLLAFTWTITPHDGIDTVVDGLIAAQPTIGARGFAVARGRTPPREVTRIGRRVIETIFAFETETGRCEGLLRIPVDEPGRAWVLMTSLRAIKGHEEPIGERRQAGSAYSRNFGGANWSDARRVEQAFADREPAVVVVGAGQAGLSLAARLRLLGVDTLVVDRTARVGDVWRHRYHSLALHNQVALNHLPYLPFPPHWPKYLPKDMLAGWLETYAWAMECNVWTGTTLVEGRYDEGAGAWSARVRRDDGSERVLRPRHLIFANGIVGRPRTPTLPGIEDFAGTLMHTHDFRSGEGWGGKRALVLGAGTSGHDVAQDLYGHGAAVTLVQRGPTTVVSVDSAGLNHAVYYDEGLPTEDCDLISASSTYPLLVEGYKLAVTRMVERDRDLIAGLDARGFKQDMGPDGTGHQMKLRRRFGGYYLNCGCSDLIIDGSIGLRQWEEIDRFVPEGVRLASGETLLVDLIVTATGYQSQQEMIGEMLGDDVAARIGPIWGIDTDGELANMFRPTPQPGLWFAGGGFAHARIYSHYVAMQIKARELGLV